MSKLLFLEARLAKLKAETHAMMETVRAQALLLSDVADVLEHIGLEDVRQSLWDQHLGRPSRVIGEVGVYDGTVPWEVAHQKAAHDTKTAQSGL